MGIGKRWSSSCARTIWLSFRSSARVLRDGGIETIVLDQHMSVLEGSAGAIPRRLMVSDEDADAARRILREVGELDD